MNIAKNNKRNFIVTICVIMCLIITALLFVIETIPVTVFSTTEIERQEALADNTLLLSKQVEEDRNLLISYVEDIHPYFITNYDRDEYIKTRDDFVNNTLTEMTVRDFKICASKYLCFFEDGHTKISFEEQYRLPFYCRYYEGKLYASDIIGEDGYVDINSDSKCISSLGNVEIDRIFETIDNLFPAENEMMRYINYGRYSVGKNILSCSGAVISDNKICVSYSDGTKKEYEFDDLYADNADTNETNSNLQAINSYIYKNGVFIIDFNECNDDEELNGILSALDNAINEGCSKVIIDARSNGGGNSSACSRILGTMGMKPPEYGSVIRFSKEAQKQRGYLRKSRSIVLKPSAKAKKNPNIDMIVLSDGNTFSSANMLLVYVRDGNLGKIVGEPSSNKPSHYGDIIYFSLPNSHLYGCVSHKKFTRPDSTVNDNIMLPDVVCMPEDAMQKALSMFDIN